MQKDVSGLPDSEALPDTDRLKRDIGRQELGVEKVMYIYKYTHGLY